MPNGQYEFTRDSTNINGLTSANRASTDAINALELWRGASPGREYEVRQDTDVKLVAYLSWNEGDENAGANLDWQSRKFGLSREFVEKSK